MAFSIRPHRRFPVHCAVTRHFDYSFTIVKAHRKISWNYQGLFDSGEEWVTILHVSS